MKIVYLYESGRTAKVNALKDGTLPSEFFYGALELERRGHTIELVEANEVRAQSKLRIAAELLIPLRYLPAKMYYAQLSGVKRILPQLENADVIIATTPGLAFSLAFWKKLGYITIPRDFIGIHCGNLNYSHNWVRIQFSKSLFKEMRTMLYGYGELNPLVAMFGLERNRIEVNLFGVDIDFWHPDPDLPREDYILSVGNDSRRDYNLLIATARQVNRPFKILTKRELPADLPDNVEVIRGSWHGQGLSDHELRELYQKAFCVTIPLLDSKQPSGQSVTLQAMACGTPVIMTKTEGIWESEKLLERSNVLLVDPGQIGQLLSSIEELCESSSLWQKLSAGGLRYTAEYGTIDQFADTMEALCLTIMELS